MTMPYACPLLRAPAGMTMQELMKDGRKGVKEIDGTLNRAEKLVEDTLQIGQQASAKDQRRPGQAAQQGHWQTAVVVKATVKQV